MNNTEQELKKLRFRLKILMGLFASALVACILLTAALFHKDMPQTSRARTKQNPPPHYQEIWELIQPLRYNGLYALIRPEVSITPDFERNVWRINNLHRFNDKGEIILEDNRYGLCGELSTYVYEKVKPLLGKKEVLNFARVAESGFFLTPQATHTVLILTDNSGSQQKNYIIDPSLSRYADRNDLDDYMIFDVHNTNPLLEGNSKNAFYSVDQGAPVLIEGDYLVSLMMEKSGSRFDKNNFVLALSATERYKYCGRYLLALRNDNGQAEIFENTALIRQILKPEEYKSLREKMFSWFQQLY